MNVTMDTKSAFVVMFGFSLLLAGIILASIWMGHVITSKPSQARTVESRIPEAK